MVVLHVTFDPHKIIYDSEKNIKQENTYAVDCLIYESEGLLECQKNADAIDKTANHFKSKVGSSASAICTNYEDVLTVVNEYDKMIK